jgi:uncharacterized protein YpiB (UPF0302 family)
MKPHFRRLAGKRRYKRMFVIVAEGKVTEQEYFQLLNDESIIHVKCLKNRSNLTPKEALLRVREHISKEGLRKTDEAWVVVDKDSWKEEHLDELHKWAQGRSNYGFVLSNPKFELWLLLHFEDAKGVGTSEECNKKLAKHLPGYDKHVDGQKFTHERIEAAIDRAKKRDIPPCADWPRNTGTTVYKLVERILKSGIISPAPMSRSH